MANVELSTLGSVIKTAYEGESDTNAFTDAEKTKLAAVESGATADQSAAEILTAIKTVDGTGSGLDADLLDGSEASAFATIAATATSVELSDDAWTYSDEGKFFTVYDEDQTGTNDWTLDITATASLDGALGVLVNGSASENVAVKLEIAASPTTYQTITLGPNSAMLVRLRASDGQWIAAGIFPQQTLGALATADTVSTSETDGLAQHRLLGRFSSGSGAFEPIAYDSLNADASPTTSYRVVLFTAAGNLVYATLGNLPGTGSTGVLTARAVSSAAVDNPTSGDWVRYSDDPVLIVLNGALTDDGEAILQLISGGDNLEIVCSNTYTINAASGADSSTNVTDLVLENQTGNQVDWTSAGSNLPAATVGDYFELRNHSDSDNNGWYILDTITSANADWTLTKLVDTNSSSTTEPNNATSEAADIDAPVALNLKSIASVKRIGTDFVVTGGTDDAKDFDGSDLGNIGDVTVAGSISGNSLDPDSASGALATTTSGKKITTSGSITIPNSAIGDGYWQGLIEVGADTHDWTHNSITLDISGESFSAGEIYSVVTSSSSAIDISGPAGTFTEADFS